MNKSYSKIRHIQESNQRLENRLLNEQTDSVGGGTQTQCDQKNPDSYPGVRYYKGLQGLFNKLFNSGLVIDGKLGPKTSEVLKKYIVSKGMTPVVGTKEYAGPSAGFIDTTFNGNKELSDKLFNFLIQDGLKTFIPSTPNGCKKFRFDK
jgi:hypothetical protein